MNYNNAGELSKIDYSDATPDVIYGYDRRGHRNSVSGVVETLDVSYNDAGQPLDETHKGGPLDGVTVTQDYDLLLRRKSLQATRGSALTNHTYTYDKASRLSTVTDGARSVTYGYLNNSYLVGALTFRQNASVVMTTSKQYDNLNRLTSIATRNAGQQALSSFAYNYNDANQRRRVDLADGSYWRYEYDLLGQVKSGKKYFADNSPVAGQQFEYDFDSIGNRQTASAGGDGSGQSLRISSYTTNSLNQYTERTVPRGFDVTGTAASDANVTVNNEPVSRKGEYFWKELLLDNSATALFAPVKTVGVKNNVGPNGEDAVTEVDGNVFVPRTPEAYAYDDDGNLISDGRWIYTWDGENRLLKMESRPDVPAAAKKKLEFVYDYQGRRVLKRVYDWNGTTFNTQPSTTLKFIYDGWNMIAELDGNNSMLGSYVWGLDLSGSLQGAGGVGGLLVMNSANAGGHFYTFDGNGNVSTLVSAADATISAEYEYSPVGESLKATSTDSEINPYRFSTKYTDREIGLLYYGFRYYDASPARWLSRDRAEEDGGGANLYAFVSNNPVGSIDQLGLYEIDFHYYVIYYLLRAKCFTKDEARRIAYESQFVDINPHTTPITGTIPTSFNPFSFSIGTILNPTSSDFFLSPESLGTSFGGGALNNAINKEQLAQYHFAGSGPNTATTRNHPFARSQAQRQLSRWQNGGSGEARETGVALHLYADTWSHDGFTPWPNKNLNRRGRLEGLAAQFGISFKDIPANLYRGHLDAVDGGHAPDRPYRDVGKALEAAQYIYELIPNRSRGKVPAFSELSGELRAQFMFAADDETSRAALMRQRIRRRFGETTSY